MITEIIEHRMLMNAIRKQTKEPLKTINFKSKLIKENKIDMSCILGLDRKSTQETQNNKSFNFFRDRLCSVKIWDAVVRITKDPLKREKAEKNLIIESNRLRNVFNAINADCGIKSA